MGFRRSVSVALPLILVLQGTASTPARGGEQEWVFTTAPAYSVIRVDEADHHGASLFLDVDYGLTDSWGLRGALHWSAQVVPEADDPLLSVGSLGFGALYTFDVFKLVPYASLTVGAAVLGGGGERLHWNADFQFGFGLDYLVTRSFSVGFEFRYHLLVPDVERYPFLFSLAIRLSWRKQ